MRECAFLHSSAYVLRSPCGEARRASLLAPLGRFADKPNLRLALPLRALRENQGQKPLSPLRGENRFFLLKNASRTNPTYGWLYPLRSTAWRISLAPLREISIVCCACFAAHKSQNRLICEFHSSLRSLKERCSLRSHKGQNLCFL